MSGLDFASDIRECYYPTPSVSEVIRILTKNQEVKLNKRLEDEDKIYKRVRDLYEQRHLLDYEIRKDIFMDDIEEQLQCHVFDLQSWIEKNETLIFNNIETATKRACIGVLPITEYFKSLKKP